MVRCCARCSTKSWAINFLPRHDDRTPLPIALTSHVAHTAPVKSAALQTPALVLNLRRTTRWCRNIRHSPTMYYNTSLPSCCRHFHSNHPPRPSIIIVVVVAEYNSPHPRISDQESTRRRRDLNVTKKNERFDGSALPGLGCVFVVAEIYCNCVAFEWKHLWQNQLIGNWYH